MVILILLNLEGVLKNLNIYGIREGSTNKQGTIVGENFSFTQKNLADEIGIDVRTMQNYKKLTGLVPEL